MSMSRAARTTLGGVLIFIGVVGIGAGAFGISTWQVHQDQLQWCATLQLLTATPESPPANPAKNPSRVAQYKLYSDFVTLRDRFGC